LLGKSLLEQEAWKIDMNNWLACCWFSCLIPFHILVHVDLYRSHALMCLLHRLIGTSKPSREFYLFFLYVSLNVCDLVDRNWRVPLSKLCAISGFFLFGCHWFFSIKMPFGQTVFISFYPCCGTVLLSHLFRFLICLRGIKLS